MAKILLFFFLLITLSSIKLSSQNNDNFPLSFLNKNIANLREKIKTHNLPLIDNDLKIKKIIKKRGLEASKSLVGIGVDVNIDVLKDAQKFDMEKGHIYIYKIQSNTAHNLQLYYKHFFLSENSFLYVYSQDKTQIIGPLTSKDNPENFSCLGNLFHSNEIIIEYFEPKNSHGKSRILVDMIKHGIKKYQKKGVLKKDDCLVCHNDSKASGKEKQAASVCELSITRRDKADKEEAEIHTGSGFLINSVCPIPYVPNCDLTYIKKPLIITANHVIKEYPLIPYVNDSFLDYEKSYAIFNQKKTFEPDCHPIILEEKINLKYLVDHQIEFQDGDWALLLLDKMPSSACLAGWTLEEDLNQINSIFSFHHGNYELAPESESFPAIYATGKQYYESRVDNVKYKKNTLESIFLASVNPKANMARISDSEEKGYGKLSKGSSGAPVFNDSKEVIGVISTGKYGNINTCKNTVTISRISRAIESMIEGGTDGAEYFKNIHSLPTLCKGNISENLSADDIKQDAYYHFLQTPPDANGQDVQFHYEALIRGINYSSLYDDGGKKNGNEEPKVYWDFGDGSPYSTDKNPVHRYTEPETYTVKFYIIDPDTGAEAEAQVFQVYVPEIVIIGRPSAAIGQPIDFSVTLPFEDEDNYSFVWGVLHRGVEESGKYDVVGTKEPNQGCTAKACLEHFWINYPPTCSYDDCNGQTIVQNAISYNSFSQSPCNAPLALPHYPEISGDYFGTSIVLNKGLGGDIVYGAPAYYSLRVFAFPKEEVSENELLSFCNDAGNPNVYFPNAKSASTGIYIVNEEKYSIGDWSGSTNWWNQGYVGSVNTNGTTTMTSNFWYDIAVSNEGTAFDVGTNINISYDCETKSFNNALVDFTRLHGNTYKKPLGGIRNVEVYEGIETNNWEVSDYIELSTNEAIYHEENRLWCINKGANNDLLFRIAPNAYSMYYMFANLPSTPIFGSFVLLDKEGSIVHSTQEDYIGRIINGNGFLNSCGDSEWSVEIPWNPDYDGTLEENQIYTGVFSLHINNNGEDVLYQQELFFRFIEGNDFETYCEDLEENYEASLETALTYDCKLVLSAALVEGVTTGVVSYNFYDNGVLLPHNPNESYYIVENTTDYSGDHNFTVRVQDDELGVGTETSITVYMDNYAPFEIAVAEGFEPSYVELCIGEDFDIFSVLGISEDSPENVTFDWEIIPIGISEEDNPATVEGGIFSSDEEVRVMYLITATNSITGCEDGINILFHVLKADIGQTYQRECEGNIIQLGEYLSFCPGTDEASLKYQWNCPTCPDGGFSSTEMMPDFVIPPAAETPYEIILTITYPNGEVFDEEFFYVESYTIEVNIPENEYVICTGESVSFEVVEEIGLTYQWTPIEGLSNPNIANPTVSPTSDMVYTLTVEDGIGCAVTKTVNIKYLEVDLEVDAIFHPIEACIGEVVNLYDYLEGEYGNPDNLSWFINRKPNVGIITTPKAFTIADYYTTIPFVPNSSPRWNLGVTIPHPSGCQTPTDLTSYVIPISDGSCPIIAVDDEITISQGETVEIDVLANDLNLYGDVTLCHGTISMTDANEDPITVDLPTQPANGQLLFSGDYSFSFNAGSAFTYIPNPDFAGTDTFIYGLCNEAGEISYATVTITVEHEGNPCSDLVHYGICTYKNSPFGVPISLEDMLCITDICENYEFVNLEESINTAAGDGSINNDLGSLCSFLYYPPIDFVGSKSFTLQYCNSKTPNMCYDIDIVVEVKDWPNEIERCVTPDGELKIYFSDFVKSCLEFTPNVSIESAVSSTNATIEIHQGSSEEYLTYEAAPNFTGIDDVIVDFSDGNGFNISMTVKINVDSECINCSDNEGFCTAADGIMFYDECLAADCGYFDEISDLNCTKEDIHVCAGEMTILGENIQVKCPDAYYYGWNVKKGADIPEFYTTEPWYAFVPIKENENNKLAITMIIYNSNGDPIGEKNYRIYFTYEVPPFKLQGIESICIGEYTDIQVEFQESIDLDDYSFVWYEHNNGWNPLINQNTSTLQVSPLQATDYLVFVVDKKTGCARSMEFTVKTNGSPLPSPIVQIHPLEQYVCNNEPFSISMEGADMYSWKSSINGETFGGGEISQGTFDLEASYDLTDFSNATFASGATITYEIQANYSDNDYCDPTIFVDVHILPQHEIEIIGPRELTVCSGDFFNFPMNHLTEDNLNGYYSGINVDYSVFAPELTWVGADNSALISSFGLVSNDYLYPIPNNGNSKVFVEDHAYINNTSSTQTITYRLTTAIEGNVINFEEWNANVCQNKEELIVNILPSNTEDCDELSSCDLLALTANVEAIPEQNIVCSGNSLSIELSGAGSYDWTTTTGGISIPNNGSSNNTNHIINQSTAFGDEGSITYTINGHIGDCVFTEIVTIEVMPSEQSFQAIPMEALICADNVISTQLTPADYYTWEVSTENGVYPFPFVYSGTVNESGGMIQQIFRDATGEGGWVTYQITGHFEDGCPIKQTHSVWVLPTPILQFTQSHQTICPDAGELFTIQIENYNPNYAYTLNFTLPNGISHITTPTLDINENETIAVYEMGFSNTGNNSEVITYTLTATQTTNIGGNWSEVCSVSETIGIKVIPNPTDKICDAEEGLIVNEVYHGGGTNIPYIELLVKGNSNCEPVDIRHYIVDDNNGDFSNSPNNAHISAGHIRFKNIDRWAAVPSGTLIVIHDMNAYYFNSDIHFLEPGQIPTNSDSYVNDPTDSNDDEVYILNINDNGLEHHPNIPYAIDFNGNWMEVNNYQPPNYQNYSYWTAIDLDENGDAVQVRNPDGTYFHGFSYGSSNDFNGGIDELQFIPNDVLFFELGDYRTASNFSSGDANNLTIGTANNADNLTYINFLKSYGCQSGGHGKQLVEESSTVSWTIYPNPSQNTFTIELSLSKNLTTDLHIFDITGKEVLKIYEHSTLAKGLYPVKVNDEQLPAGVYICQLKYTDETGQEHRDYLKLVKTQ